MPLIELHSEYLFSLLGLSVTNTVFTSVLVTLILTVFAILFSLQEYKFDNVIVKGLRVLIFELLRLTDSVTRDRELSKKVLPLIATFFLFIVTANLVELLPGFLGAFFLSTPAGPIPLLRSPNSSITTTLALALISVTSIQIFSVQALGWKGFLERFINLANPLAFILGFFELLSESVKILSFSFRLFGNIFAGEVLLLIIAFLTPYFVPVPFMFLEVFVGIVQAFIFAILTLNFVKTGTMRHMPAAPANTPTV